MESGTLVAPKSDASPERERGDFVEKRESPISQSKPDQRTISQEDLASPTMMTTTSALPPPSSSIRVPESANKDNTNTTPFASNEPAATPAMVSSHRPVTSDPTQPSKTPGTSTTIRADTPPSMTSQPLDAPTSEHSIASQPDPSTNTASEPQKQQPDPSAPATSGSEEPKPADPAIGPSTDLTTTNKEAEDVGKSLVINLLLTTGARHPFKISTKYLRKRQVDVPDFDPYLMSVYTLKELIWTEWRQEWEPRPSSPTSIRLISFGKLLDDKGSLSELKLSQSSPNVFHMTLKPQEVVDEEDAKAARSATGRQRDGGDHSPRCRCIIL
ncbi:hypothetical protein ACO22_06949 [Paracoccidioides brasiliensis]|uniref:UBL3-like ubiquitin domain-containing protein n=1 Tax=Paracoccidioides brasiliensis TaxID=121759 RepID=A0A1D2J653_PARBR|nr:hypothetical protein ACO22_06949 [Paracoccidioides brasiliensis]ODH49792.1 hypothetical protein GX48_04020 [Paracoccidioides brasiliensis]